MNKRTPPPWVAVGRTVFPGADRALSVAIATQHRDEATANARLVAAAPELYAALVAALKAHGSDYSWGPAALAAIAKADGL